MRTSLLISTYNWPEALELVFLSLKGQSIKPDEVLIADDGSARETGILIENFQKEMEVPIRHFWHEDKGFRKSIILNKSLAAAKGDYIIQIDGDCIMHELFLESHLRFVKKNNFLFGSRVNIREDYLPELFSKRKVKFSLFARGLSKRTRNVHNNFLASLYKETDKLSKKIRGCNISYWKEDVVKVNGYNEDFTGWGKEDSELVVRLLNNGISGRRLRYNAIVYHIWHRENSRERSNTNNSIQQKALEEKLRRCENGIDKYMV